MDHLTLTADALQTGDTLYGLNGRILPTQTVKAVLVQADHVTLWTRLPGEGLTLAMKYRPEDVFEVVR